MQFEKLLNSYIFSLLTLQPLDHNWQSEQSIALSKLDIDRRMLNEATANG